MIKLKRVHFRQNVSSPLLNEHVTSFETGDANGYDIQKAGDYVVVGAPAWDDEVVLVPWSEVMHAHSTWDDVLPANDNGKAKK